MLVHSSPIAPVREELEARSRREREMLVRKVAGSLIVAMTVKGGEGERKGYISTGANRRKRSRRGSGRGLPVALGISLMAIVVSVRDDDEAAAEAIRPVVSREIILSASLL